MNERDILVFSGVALAVIVVAMLAQKAIASRAALELDQRRREDTQQEFENKQSNKNRKVKIFKRIADPIGIF